MIDNSWGLGGGLSAYLIKLQNYEKPSNDKIPNKNFRFDIQITKKIGLHYLISLGTFFSTF